MSKRLINITFTLLTFFTILAFFPQKSKAVMDHVVISEVQVAGTTATDEFVELYNPTNSDVSLTGWRLSKKTSTGTLSNLLTTISGVIPAHGYFLITHPTGYDGTIIQDAVYSTSSSVTPDNTVILYNDAGINIVDKIGMGQATDFETAVFPTNPPADGSISRLNETDNNSIDFEVLNISDPQNSLTPTITPTPTITIDPTPTIGPTASPTPTVTASPELTVTPIPTNEPSPSIAPTPTPTMADTPTPSASPEPTSTPTIEPTTSATPFPTPTPKQNPVFSCSNHHIPQFVYQMLMFLMPQKFNC